MTDPEKLVGLVTAIYHAGQDDEFAHPSVSVAELSTEEIDRVVETVVKAQQEYASREVASDELSNKLTRLFQAAFDKVTK